MDLSRQFLIISQEISLLQSKFMNNCFLGTVCSSYLDDWCLILNSNNFLGCSLASNVDLSLFISKSKVSGVRMRHALEHNVGNICD